MRQEKRVLSLSNEEYRLTLHGLLCFRNKLIEQGLKLLLDSCQ